MYVKSAYKLYFDRILDREEWCVEGDWNKLWSLQIPLNILSGVLGGIAYQIDQSCKIRVECSLECVVCQILHGVKMASLFSL